MRVSGYKENQEYYREKMLKLLEQNKRYREFVTDIKKSLLTSEGEDMFFDWLENELENFKDETKHIKPIANEYLMRENKRYREAIDKTLHKCDLADDTGHDYTDEIRYELRKALEGEE